jgi:hypothetical protein
MKQRMVQRLRHTRRDDGSDAGSYGRTRAEERPVTAGARAASHGRPRSRRRGIDRRIDEESE